MQLSSGYYRTLSRQHHMRLVSQGPRVVSLMENKTVVHVRQQWPSIHYAPRSSSTMQLFSGYYRTLSRQHHMILVSQGPRVVSFMENKTVVDAVRQQWSTV